MRRASVLACPRLATVTLTVSCAWPIIYMYIYTVAEKYFCVFRSRFAVCLHLCPAFHVRASRFAVCRHLCFAFHVRVSRFVVCHHLCFAFLVRDSHFLVRDLYFLVCASHFAFGSSWFHSLQFLVLILRDSTRATVRSELLPCTHVTVKSELVVA